MQSKHRHDFVSHTDKNGKEYAVDGGTSYLRRVGNMDYEDLSVYDDSKHETRREHLVWGRNFDKDMNRLPETEWIKIKDMSTGHIEAVLDGGFVKDEFYIEVFEEELKLRNE
ncbi:MAG: hypothetical protein WD512_04310 [Candidatus Paceibacterota bacterium]